MPAPLATAPATRAIVVVAIHGMSANATSHPPASGRACTAQARLAPKPSSAFAQRTMRAPFAPSAAASAASSGRTTATTSGNAASRWRAEAAPMHSPPGSTDRSLSPPKRSPRPAASRMPTTGAALASTPSLRQQPELAVLHRDEHACPLIHPVVIGGRRVEHPLAADDLALGLDRIAQR